MRKCLYYLHYIFIKQDNRQLMGSKICPINGQAEIDISISLSAKGEIYRTILSKIFSRRSFSIEDRDCVIVFQTNLFRIYEKKPRISQVMDKYYWFLDRQRLISKLLRLPRLKMNSLWYNLHSTPQPFLTFKSLLQS